MSNSQRGRSQRGSSPTVKEGSPLTSSHLPGALLDSRATAPLATAPLDTAGSAIWLPDDNVLSPITSTVAQLDEVIDRVLRFAADDPQIDAHEWERGRYCPTPTIIEAALALYKGHSVDDITRHEADKPDISRTTDAIDDIIRASRNATSNRFAL